MPRSRSMSIQSLTVPRRPALPCTAPAEPMTRACRASASVSVDLPASGWLMTANVRRRRASAATSVGDGARAACRSVRWCSRVDLPDLDVVLLGRRADPAPRGAARGRSPGGRPGRRPCRTAPHGPRAARGPSPARSGSGAGGGFRTRRAAPGREGRGGPRAGAARAPPVGTAGPPAAARRRAGGALDPPHGQLADLPDTSSTTAGTSAQRNWARVIARGVQQPVEDVHLGDQHGEHELDEQRPVHLLAVERGGREHRAGLAAALERGDDQAEREGGEGDRPADLEAAEGVGPEPIARAGRR